MRKKRPRARPVNISAAAGAAAVALVTARRQISDDREFGEQCGRIVGDLLKSVPARRQREAAGWLRVQAALRL